MKLRIASLALALAAMTAAPVAAQEMQATLPVASDDDAPLDGAAPMETATDVPQVAEASAPAETAPVETAVVEAVPAETAPVETAPVETAPVETAQVDPTPAAEPAPAPAPAAKRTFMEKAMIAAGTLAAAYAAFEAMKALNKKKPAATPVTTQ